MSRTLSFIRVLVKPALLLKLLIRYLPGLSLHFRIKCDAMGAGPYAWGMYNAAVQAKALDIPAISVIEFGVAGGNGLVAMERVAIAIERELGIDLAIYGFDIKEGLPKAEDYRDLAYAWQSGAYKMDEQKLRSKLSRSTLVLGDVKETVPAFLDDEKIPPLGFVAIDLDYYSSTNEALRILERDTDRYLPRVLFYFDDILGNDEEYHCEFVGEMLSIEEFNQGHEKVKLGKVHGFPNSRIFPDTWNVGVYVCHFFEHPMYNRYVLGKPKDLSLR